MAIDLDAHAMLSETTYPNEGNGVSGGMDRGSGTLRELVKIALAAPEEQFANYSITVLPDGPVLQPDDIRELAMEHDIEAA